MCVRKDGKQYHNTTCCHPCLDENQIKTYPASVYKGTMSADIGYVP